LPRGLRLPNSDAFRRVFGEARRYPGPGFLVLARRGTGLGPRLGIAISKRCSKRAVDRNRLKRIARESFRHRASALPIVDVVVLCTRESVLLDAKRLRQTLDEAWERIRSKPWDDS
jgi:ribonuclease P protein component